MDNLLSAYFCFSPKQFLSSPCYLFFRFTFKRGKKKEFGIHERNQIVLQTCTVLAGRALCAFSMLTLAKVNSNDCLLGESKVGDPYGPCLLFVQMLGCREQ